MPVVSFVYRWPCLTAASPEGAVLLFECKKRAAQLRDELLGYQKAAQKAGDFDGARFFREEAAEQMKMYRAATFLLPWHTNEPSGDCREMGPSAWPVELAPQLDHLTGLVDSL